MSRVILPADVEKVETVPSVNEGCILMIDWSVISYKCWHRMKGANYVAQQKTEKKEFAMNIYLYLSYLVERFQPSETIFAVDSNPNWRVQYYKDWYIKKSTIYYNKETNEYLTEWDFKIHKFSYHETQEIWVKYAQTKAKFHDLVIEGEEFKDVKKKDLDAKVWEKFYKGIPDYEKITDLAEKERILYGDLYAHTPRYKKRDKDRNWDYQTSYEEFKKCSFNLAFTCANTFNAKAIHADGAEADDIAAAYCEGRAKTGKDFILVSVDQDLYQLAMTNMFFKYFNPNGTREAPSHYGVFIPLKVPQVKSDLYTKILLGDKSDTIFATFRTGDRKLLTPKQSEDIMLKSEKPLAEIQKVIDRDILIRNTTLVHLKKRPKYIFENIIKAIKEYKTPKETYGPDAFGVTEVQHLTNMTMAREHREYDSTQGEG